jgi:hypothetical protein
MVIWLKPFLKTMLINFLLGVAVFSAVRAQESAPATFSFSPMPRWTEEPENEMVCQAVKKECPKAWKSRQDAFKIGYDLMYDAKGVVSGMRITSSSACKPVDEYYQFFKRSMLFSPRLEGLWLELAPSVKPEDVRIVKSDITNFSYSCN